MGTQQVITLDFLRAYGKREMMKLHHHTLSEARNMADSVFRKGDGLYVEVEISVRVDTARHYRTSTQPPKTFGESDRLG
jgi:hypothetical protein